MNITAVYDLSPEDFKIFTALFIESIMPLYPSSTQKTAESIIAKHKLGIDNEGYFTKKKTIWKGMDENKNIIAFTVVSEKRGGSIKFGPTMVIQDKRNRGVGSAFRLVVETYYKNKGCRKAYSTTNIKNYSAIFYALKIGYKIELHLRKHYSRISDEVVISKMLNYSNNTMQEVSIPKEYPEYIVNYMKKYYSEIDNGFFENIMKTVSNEHTFTENCYIGKKKYIFQNDSDKLYAVTFPKRGGCIKISSLILNDDEISSMGFVQSIFEFYKNTPVHKFYTLDLFNNP